MLNTPDAAVRDLLAATGEFEGVYLGSLPEQRGQAAGDLRAAAIEPADTAETDLSDAAPTGRLDLAASLVITVLARDEDEEIRDSEAERLVNVVNNAVNGTDLGGLAMPQFTRVTSWKYARASAPERRVTMTLTFRYQSATWNAMPAA